MYLVFVWKFPRSVCFCGLLCLPVISEFTSLRYDLPNQVIDSDMKQTKNLRANNEVLELTQHAVPNKLVRNRTPK